MYVSLGANMHLPRLVKSPGNRPNICVAFNTYYVIESSQQHLK